jgi:predicted phage terminase large subunit-like protein
MIMMPPGSAKSTYSTILLPPWWFVQHPNSIVLGASHKAEFALGFSSQIQRYIRDNSDTLGYSLATENKSMWETTNGCKYYATSVSGGIAGLRADLAIIDDPVSGRLDAESETFRNRTWDWYISDLSPRLKPTARVILIMTRWHMDDLAGRLLETEAKKWRIIKLPAIATDADDPLGREPGEYLWSDDAYGYASSLQRIQEQYENAGAMRDWASLYQQTPTPGGGGLFRVEMIETMDAQPEFGWDTVRAWDLAATRDVGTRDPSWTVGVKLQRAANDKLIVLDVKRLRGGPDEVEAAIVNTANQDGYNVKISLPQDPGQAGKAQSLYLTRKLMGFNVEATPETGDKATRAAPVVSQVNVGNLAVVRAPWNRPFLDELANFPSGTHEDQVDALSRAFSVLVPQGLDIWMKLAS